MKNEYFMYNEQWQRRGGLTFSFPPCGSRKHRPGPLPGEGRVFYSSFFSLLNRPSMGTLKISDRARSSKSVTARS